MRECHLYRCSRAPEQFRECRERAAYHEAGHALVLCCVRCSEGGTSPSPLGPLALNLGSDLEGFPLPEESVARPWNDALVLLGGPAADEVLFGQAPRMDGNDWARAARLMRDLGLRDHVGDGFGMTKELVAHHRAFLESVAGALLSRGAVPGAEVWRRFEEGLAADPAREARSAGA